MNLKSIILLGGLLGGGTLHGAAFQDAAMSQVRLTTQTTIGDPTAAFSVPVYVEIPSNLNLKSFTFNVKYSKDAMVFEKAEKGFLLEAPEFVLKLEPSKPAAQEGFQEVQITISSSAADKPMPQGSLLSLYFTIAPKMLEELEKKTKAAPDTATESGRSTVTLQSSFKEAKTMDGKPVPPERLTTADEPLNLFKIKPVQPCFFYMH
ncbi:MAG: hypothetical protein HY645_15540 [Acidobacteria bacterium]|nr:hypothetical protein [Acidobacteriota bacterium]